MTSADKIYELIKDMPPHQVNEVCNFAEFLRRKSTKQAVEPPAEISTEPKLKPLILLDGYVPEGWKDAIYEPYT